MSIDIFSHSSYRDFLKDLVRSLKSSGKGSASSLAEACKVHPTFFSQILKGDKDLSAEQAALLAESLQMTEFEFEFLLALVQHSRAGNQRLLKFWEGKLKKLKQEKAKLKQNIPAHTELSDEQKAVYYSSWMYAAARLSADIDGGQSRDQIARRLGISKDTTANVLSYLVQHGLCTKDGDRHKMGTAHVHIPGDSPLVFKHHYNWRMQAQIAMERSSRDDLFMAVPSVMAEADFLEIRKDILAFAKSLFKKVEKSKSEELYCFNLDYFRVGK